MVFKVLVLLVVVGTIYAKVVPVPRVVGGSGTTISSAPYLVELQFENDHICGGSLLTKKCVLTAAHCVKTISENEISQLKVRAGLNYLNETSSTEKVRVASSIFNHPSYDRFTNDFDVAIIKFDQEISEESAKLVTLASKTPDKGQKVEVRGWGITEEGANVMSNLLKKVDLYVIDKEKCIKQYEEETPVTQNMFCAAANEGKNDACVGDSGGPIVFNGEQIGIVSWGKGCGHEEYSGVYTDVNAMYIRRFIKKIKAEHC